MAIALMAWLMAPAPIAWTSTFFWVRTTPAIAPASAMQSLLRVLHAAGLAEHDHLDAAAVAPLTVEALGDLPGHDLRLVIADLVWFDENPQLLAGEHREAALDAIELVGDRLDAFEALDRRCKRFPARTGTRRADRVGGHEDRRGR